MTNTNKLYVNMISIWLFNVVVVNDQDLPECSTDERWLSFFRKEIRAVLQNDPNDFLLQIIAWISTHEPQWVNEKTLRQSFNDPYYFVLYRDIVIPPCYSYVEHLVHEYLIYTVCMTPANDESQRSPLSVSPLTVSPLSVSVGYADDEYRQWFHHWTNYMTIVFSKLDTLRRQSLPSVFQNEHDDQAGQPWKSFVKQQLYTIMGRVIQTTDPFWMNYLDRILLFIEWSNTESAVRPQRFRQSYSLLWYQPSAYFQLVNNDQLSVSDISPSDLDIPST